MANFRCRAGIAGSAIFLMLPLVVNAATGDVPYEFSVGDIVALGNRIVDYSNRLDVEGLYSEMDEVALARRKITKAGLKRQLQLNHALWGLISAAAYQGEMDVDVDMDVPVKKLAYDILLDRPGREDIVLAITATAGAKGLRIVEFSIERGILVKARGTSTATDKLMFKKEVPIDIRGNR